MFIIVKVKKSSKRNKFFLHKRSLAGDWLHVTEKSVRLPEKKTKEKGHIKIKEIQFSNKRPTLYKQVGFSLWFELTIKMIMMLEILSKLISISYTMIYYTISLIQYISVCHLIPGCAHVIILTTSSLVDNSIFNYNSSHIVACLWLCIIYRQNTECIQVFQMVC